MALLCRTLYGYWNDAMKAIMGWGHHQVTPKLLDRETGDEIDEPLPYHGEAELGIFYNDFLGRLFFWSQLARVYFRWRGKLSGWIDDKPRSAKDIRSFAKTYKVDLDVIEKPVEEYKTLNEFFSRRLKQGVRPIAAPEDPSIAVCPADSRALVFDKVSIATSLWIKGQNFSIQKLITSKYDAAEWDNCPLVINRLSPVDYHRLHAPVTGLLKHVSFAGKTLYAVEAAAIHSAIDVFGENERAILEFDSPAFGDVMMCIIGASQVGSCNVTAKEGQHIKKGEEVGYFSYGGSATVTLFKPGCIKWDEDLAENSRHLWETKVKYGQSLGVMRALGRPQARTEPWHVDSHEE